MLVGTLIDLVFALNPHNSGVANAEIEETQCTIAWRIDDNKNPRKNENAAKDIVSKLEELI